MPICLHFTGCRFLISFLFIFCTGISFSQNYSEIKGTVKDAITGEAIIGATVTISGRDTLHPTKGVITDFEGNYSIKVDSGSFILMASFVGYERQTAAVKVLNKPVILNFTLQIKTLNEVEIVADVARTRETPVAFSNMPAKQIQEELGTRDIPMVLNSTPGAYATEQGGGSGDARVTIRGFDQRNVAVMVDGVPVNDMENGWVYWSNWDGLSDITRTMQVQRGLGASKLAIASVGGTINIISKGIDQKMGASIKQEVNDYGLYKSSCGYNSGQLKGGWGITLGGSRKFGNGFANTTFTDAWSYFIKIQKRLNKHLISISANGAPQKHGQRTERLPISVYSENLANLLDINTDSVYRKMGSDKSQYYTTLTQGERGIKYNPNSGNLNGKTFNDKVNYFHKPQFNFSHFWNINEKLNVSTVLYVSIGKGGGTGLKNSVSRDTTDGLLKIQEIYDYNLTSVPNTAYDSTGHPSNNYLRSAINNHLWYGLLSSWNYKVGNFISVLTGVDVRYYKGTHFQSVYDLIGGDYAIDNTDKNQPKGFGNTQYGIKRVGDKVSYYNDAIVMWGGAFAQAEFKKNKWSAFVTASLSETGYQRFDYFKKNDLVLSDTTMLMIVGYGDTIIRNGIKYTNQSNEARTATTDQKWFLGYTLKGGTNYNITNHHNVFVNIGYLNMAPRMNSVFDNNNNLFKEIKNQEVSAVEGGYGFKHSKYAANLNLYYTIWKNKPPFTTAPKISTPDGDRYYNINGLNALHKGIELDFIYKILTYLDIEGLASIGDWKTTSGAKAYLTDDDGVIHDSVDFSAINVHVGDAAQIQYGTSIRCELIPRFIRGVLFIKPRYSFFAKNYSNFVPISLVDENKDRESWQMPNYGLLDIYAGYEIKCWKLNFTVTAGVMNLMNTIYLTDAQNGANFDATTATVYVGPGRRIVAGLRINF